MYKIIKPFRADTDEVEKIPSDAIYLFTRKQEYKTGDKIYHTEFYLYYEMPSYWREDD